MKKMTVETRKLITLITFIAEIMTVLTLFSCKDGFDILPEYGKSGMVKVAINVMGNRGRTVQPTLPDLSDITKFVLLGGKGTGTEETFLLEFYGQNGSIYLEPATWHFTLNAYKNNVIILSGILEKDISLESENVLHFYLFPLNSGTGAIHITFSLPEGAGITQVTANYDKYINGKNNDVFNINSEDTEFIYNKTNVPADDYFISFQFFNGSDKPVRVISELVRVRSRLTSEKTIQPFTAAFTGVDLNAITPLTVDAWADGSIVSGGVQWFTFTGTIENSYINSQVIHVNFGTLTRLYVVVYDSTGNSLVDTTLEGSSKSFYFQPLNENGNFDGSGNIGREYYVMVSASGGSGTYQIAFNTSDTPPTKVKLPSNAITLNDALTGGNNSMPSNVQWFKFNATNSTQYINVAFETLSLFIRLYDSSGNAVGNLTKLYGNINYISRTVDVGQNYYVRIYGSSGSGEYSISVNDHVTEPYITPLTVDAWADGSIVSSGAVQWFTFTGTIENSYINSQVIHVNFGTLTSLYIVVYDSTGNSLVDTYLGGSSKSFYFQPLNENGNIDGNGNIGREYYVRVSASGGSGSYQIAFNTSDTAPTKVNLPFDAITLNDALTGGNNSTPSSVQWFKFNATNSTQYINVAFETLSLFIQLYDSNGNAVGNLTQLYGSINYISRTVEVGQDYYVRVYGSSGSGEYSISVNEQVTAPYVTPLTVDVWADGSIVSSGAVQWFTFTGTIENSYYTYQHIHVNFGTLTSLYIVVYDSTGNSLVDTYLGGSSKSFYFQPLNENGNIDGNGNIGREYYVRVSASGGNGTFQIAFNTSDTPP